ncbi:MAG: hypothetical protein GY857_20315, partial [Desulfobacula sp.]|nr:hypothetical protein [Desulfobacula sp.]
MKHCYRIRQSTNKSKKHTLLKTMLIFICFLLLTSMASANSVVDSVKSIIENPQNGIDAEKTLQDVFDSLGYGINVATDETGIETFCALPGQNIATIIVEYAGSAVSAKSGWYLANDSSVLHQLFSGSDVTGDSTQFTVTGGSSIGFYMKPGLGGSPEDVWFTQNSMSAGSDDFAWVFKTGVPHEYIIA